MCSAGAHTVHDCRLCSGDCAVSEARGRDDPAAPSSGRGGASDPSTLRCPEPSSCELALQARLGRRGAWGVLGRGHASVLFPNAPYRIRGRRRCLDGDLGLCWDCAGGRAVVTSGGAASAEWGPALAPAGLLGGWLSQSRTGWASCGLSSRQGLGWRPVACV